MKLINSLLFVILISFASSCSSSDDDSGASLAGIPSGEIVSIELRNEALTGFSTLGKSSNNKNKGRGDQQKWWTHFTSSFKWSDGCNEDDEIESNLGYIALYPNGKVYQKISIDGSIFDTGTWQWTDGNKTALYRNGETNIAFKITYLNNGNLVFGAVLSDNGCTVTTYEECGSPYFE